MFLTTSSSQSIVASILVAVTLHTATASPFPAATVDAKSTFKPRDEKPNLPYDPNTTAACSYWWDNDGSITCSNMPAEWGITSEQFLAWNPSITTGCGNFVTGRSYCVEAASSPSPTSTPSPTGPSNGVATPSPIQDGMVENCNKFHFVKSGDSCAAVARTYGVTESDFITWNPAVGRDCAALWINTYACVGLIGGSTTQLPPPTTTKPSNGVTTPSPIQDGLTEQCSKFHFVQSGNTCPAIAKMYGISVADFYKWNPAVGSDCTSLWINTYACVAVLGGSPTTTSAATTTTSAGNGISTPLPIQPGMVDNCDAFHFVKSSETCASIAKASGISVTQLISWNPSVNSDCSGMWANAYVCVSTIGHTPSTSTPSQPTTTRPGNGVATPTPVQDGITTNCKTFYFVKSGNTCDSIAKTYGISTANFIKWNPAVGNDCSGLWTNTYACVALL